MAIRAECGHYCASCKGGAQDVHRVVPAARPPLDDRAAAAALDDISDEEQWLWRLVDEAERVSAAAPPAPDPARMQAVEQRFASACQAEDVIQTRIRATEAALSRPSSWLRPGHRAALVNHLREDRANAVAAAVHRGRIEDVRHRLRALEIAHKRYLAEHRDTLSAGENARLELDRIFDDLIDGYARLSDPPVWFRFGIGFPPPPGTQREWLSQARQAIAQRRRRALQEPNW